jgi:hypothetical protein
MRYSEPEVRRATIIHHDGAIEAIVGFRAWRLSFSGGVATLRSMYAAQEWTPHTVLDAECKATAWHSALPYNHEATDETLAPHREDCRCGIYSFRTPQQLGLEVWSLPPSIHGGYVVAGEVYLWGRIRVHKRGYRAEHAKIACLYPEFLPKDYGIIRTRVARAGAAARMGIELAALQYEVPLVQASNPN